jgi:hypothetical protein
MKKLKFSLLFAMLLASLLLSLPLFLAGCSRKPLADLSPTEALKKHARAAEQHDRKTLRKLIYREPGMTDEDIEKKIDSETGENRAYLKPLIYLFKLIFDMEVAGEKIVSESRAYVYIQANAIFQKPKAFAAALMVRQDGIWKPHGSVFEAETKEDWRRLLKENPHDVDLHYFLGMDINDKKKGDSFISKRYDKIGIDYPRRDITEEKLQHLRKYLKQEPEGFWANEANNVYGILSKHMSRQKKYRDRLKQDPYDMESLMGLGCEYGFGLYQYTKALMFFKRYKEAHPDGPEIDRVTSYIEQCEIELELHKEYFRQNPNKLKQIEAELGYRLFDDDYYKTLDAAKTD